MLYMNDFAMKNQIVTFASLPKLLLFNHADHSEIQSTQSELLASAGGILLKIFELTGSSKLMIRLPSGSDLRFMTILPFTDKLEIYVRSDNSNNRNPNFQELLMTNWTTYPNRLIGDFYSIWKPRVWNKNTRGS